MYTYDYYQYDDEHFKTNMTNTVVNKIAQNFTGYFHYKYNLPLETMTYTDDLNEIFFKDGSICGHSFGSLGKLCSVLREHDIPYKSYHGAISIQKCDLYYFTTYIKMQGEWRDEWKYFK